MLFTDKLKSIAREAQAIHKSMTVQRASEASTTFQHEGQQDGFRRSLGLSPAREAACQRFTELVADVYKGRRPVWHLRESMTTSDFPLLFGDLLYRQMLGNYMPYPVSYPDYFQVRDVNDFRNLNLYTIDGATSALSQVIHENEPYPETKFTEGRYQIKVGKYGRRYSISFEMVVNDDLEAFQERPMMMAQGARRGEELLATQQMFDANGPHASYYTSGNKNIVTGSPALSNAALQTAYTVLRAQLDAEGSPIQISAVRLVVPPALEVTANNIKNAVQIWLNEVGGTTNQQVHTGNWFGARFQVSVNPYIPLVVTAGTKGNTSWGLVADPTDRTSRPAFIFGFLRGRRTPQLFMRDPNSQNLAGGDADPMDGSFDTDTLDYKVRHIFGATQGDPKMSVASVGQ